MLLEEGGKVGRPDAYVLEGARVYGGGSRVDGQGEDDVFLGPSMVFTNIINPRSQVIRKEQYMRTFVRKGATIGANATIVCGHEIGEYAFIGAGTVVTKNVKPYELIVGNPGRHAGWMSEFGHRLVFDENGLAICPESHEKYFLKEGIVRKEESL